MGVLASPISCSSRTTVPDSLADFDVVLMVDKLLGLIGSAPARESGRADQADRRSSSDNPTQANLDSV